MGYVFTPREFSEGKVPSSLDYGIARKALRDGLLKLCKEGIIYGAKMHGSTFHTDGGPGSDIDIFVVTNSLESSKQLRELKNRVQGPTHVPVEFVPRQRHMTEQGYHDIGCFYFRYMQDFGITIGNDPLQVVKPLAEWDDPRAEVMKRLEKQMLKFSKDDANIPRNYGEAHCDFLERLLRQPIYAAIDMLRLRSGSTYPSSDRVPLSKYQCCQLYQEEFSLHVEDLSAVMQARLKYREFLKSDKPKTPAEYVGFLEELDGLYLNAVRFIGMNFDFLSANHL